MAGYENSQQVAALQPEMERLQRLEGDLKRLEKEKYELVEGGLKRLEKEKEELLTLLAGYGNSEQVEELQPKTERLQLLEEELKRLEKEKQALEKLLEGDSKPLENEKQELENEANNLSNARQRIIIEEIGKKNARITETKDWIGQIDKETPIVRKLLEARGKAAPIIRQQINGERKKLFDLVAPKMNALTEAVEHIYEETKNHLKILDQKIPKDVPSGTPSGPTQDLHSQFDQLIHFKTEFDQQLLQLKKDLLGESEN